MAKQPPKTAWTLMLLVLFAMLGAFGYYTYTGTVVHLPGGSSSAPLLLPRIRVEESQAAGGRVVVAYLSLENSGVSRLRLVDTQALTPLYEFQLRMKPEGEGALELVPPTARQLDARRSAATSAAAFDSEHDAVVELIPGSALTRPLPLSALYDLKRDGKYELTVTYQPETIVKDSSEPALLGVHAQRLVCSYGFELSLHKPAAGALKKNEAKKAEPPKDAPPSSPPPAAVPVPAEKAPAPKP